MNWFLNRVIIEPFERLLDRVLSFLPDMLGALVIFVVGILLAWALKALSVRLFRTINIDRYCDRTSISELLVKGGIQDKPSVLLGRLVLWLVVICFSILSLYSLNLPAVEHLLQKLLFYLPNVFAGLIIVLIGYLAGNFFARATLIGAVNAGWRSSGSGRKVGKGFNHTLRPYHGPGAGRHRASDHGHSLFHTFRWDRSCLCDRLWVWGEGHRPKVP